MNDLSNYKKNNLLKYQSLKLQELINETIKCCEDRKIFENQKFGVPYAEIKCLLLFQGERYLTVKTIAQKMDVAKSRVTKLINGLFKKGYVERIEDPQDTRVKLISLTPQGLKKFEEVNEFHLYLHQKILNQLSNDERMNLISYLEKLRSCMEVIKEEFS